VLLFEAAIAANPIEAVADLLRQNPGIKLVVVTTEPDQDLTLELFRRGVHAIVSREVEPELLVDCLRKVSKVSRGSMAALRNGCSKPIARKARASELSRPKVQLTPKETLIVSCVTQGMKNKEIAVRVGTTEQVVKNYLRKSLRQAGRRRPLELALYCLNSRILDSSIKDNSTMKDTAPKPSAIAETPQNGNRAATVPPNPPTPETI